MLKAMVKVNIQIQLEDETETSQVRTLDDQLKLDVLHSEIKYPLAEHFAGTKSVEEKATAEWLLKQIIRDLHDRYGITPSTGNHTPKLELAMGGCQEPNGSENGAH